MLHFGEGLGLLTNPASSLFHICHSLSVSVSLYLCPLSSVSSLPWPHVQLLIFVVYRLRAMLVLNERFPF